MRLCLSGSHVSSRMGAQRLTAISCQLGSVSSDSIQQSLLMIGRQSYPPIPLRHASPRRTLSHRLSFGPGVGLGQTKQTSSKRLNRFRLDREAVWAEGSTTA